MPYTPEPVAEPLEFTAVQLKVASPEVILSWSHGEVLKPETINYRTQKPERDGLFCERIFGPIKDYECYCGKYKKIRYQGIICEKCGVEVTKSAVRRVRMGHIDLAVPVSHTWYVQGVPSQISLLLDMSVADLEKVVYFAAYVVLEVNDTVRNESLEQLEREYAELRGVLLDNRPAADVTGDELLKLQQFEATYKESKSELEHLERCQVISEQVYHDLSLRYGSIVRVGIGAEALHDLLRSVDLVKGIEDLERQAALATPLNRRRVLRRIKLYSDLKAAETMPSSLVLFRVPVIPPELRPMVQLDGGRFAASDLNDLYRRVLNRNNRLKKLLNSGAPEVITRNEKRMLQEAVDALIDNSARRGKAAAPIGAKRRLKSLSDMLRGKQGRFRQNLLGKRVDYSGRSVIVVGPNLKLDQCGLPKAMALELFKPFITGKLIEKGEVHNVRNAGKMIEAGEAVVWDVLDEIIKDYFVLLNRAPTLHRLGIQAFRPVLIEGKSIQIHPLVCTAYNADFDGDMMAVHVPLSKQAQAEAATIMRSSNNLLKPASGEVIVSPSKDMLLGCYYMTLPVEGLAGEGKAFASSDEAIMAHEQGSLNLRAKVKVRIDEELMETTVGQVLFNQIVPAALGYQTETMGKKSLGRLIARSFRELGTPVTAEFVNDLKDIGFKYAEYSGITFALSDILVPEAKAGIIVAADLELEQIDKQYRRGLITADERYVKAVEMWMATGKKIEKAAMANFPSTNPIMTIVSSGARGSATNINQIAGMKGLVINPSGEVIEIPIKQNYKDGLTVFEYFTSTHGSRKGRADGAIRTADAGYLTRRLVDVAQDVVVTVADCDTIQGHTLYKEDQLKVSDCFEDALVGRTLLGDQFGIAGNTLISEEEAGAMVAAGAESVIVRSPLYCTAARGICQACYGISMASGVTVAMGEAVGIIAAQAIGEPGTQLTMRTFHMGGVASAGGDITSGLPRVEELFEARSPKIPAVLAEVGGVVTLSEDMGITTVKVSSTDPVTQKIDVPARYTIAVHEGDVVQVRDLVASTEGGRSMRATLSGTVHIDGNKVTISAAHNDEREYTVGSGTNLRVAHGEHITAGTAITEGHIDVQELLRLAGRPSVERYLVAEVQAIYTDQGVAINNKHVEIIVRQMFSKMAIVEPGDSGYIAGQVVEVIDAYQAEASGKTFAADQQLSGITRISLMTKSFLSAASFQETTKVLIDAAVQGKRDDLRGLKENVIIGKLIPAGTGFTG